MSKTILVTGSAGFIGTNLVGLLLKQGHIVIALDNFSSSEKWKSEIYKDNPNYYFFEVDITDKESLYGVLEQFPKVDEIYNLACPASPPRYMNLSLETIKVNTEGMINILEVAKRYGAKILHTSTSEIYGDPLVHPQQEDYRGNVNTIGPRSCYDEGKRISETICYEYHRLFNLDIKIVRIFNTYGPYMDPQDGRVITNFILQALKNEDITMYGDGKQTRSFQYIDDLLDGMIRYMERDIPFQAINIGNPEEFTILELAEIVIKMTNSKSKIIFCDLPKDDPKQRKPDISKAMRLLDWRPRVRLEKGLEKTIEYYKAHIIISALH